MARTIGIRGYKVTAYKKGDTTPIPFNSSEFNISPQEFLTNFATETTDVVQNDELERSWYFENIQKPNLGHIKGFIRYGTYGFESDFINNKTKKKNYHRETDDVEEIPLYYEFWCPPSKDFALLVFQSFQGRSCISQVLTHMREKFEKENNNYSLNHKKLLPTDDVGSVFNKAPVKSLQLIKCDAPSDITDRYFKSPKPNPIDFEIKLTAKRNSQLGSLLRISKSVPQNTQGLIEYGGYTFDKAIAEIRIGGKLRKVGVFGNHNDAGVIDITDSVKFGENGHPTFESLENQAKKILKDYYKILSE